ncbi:DNA adenine methylase, partial [Klebsiella pneumoniae]|uniref:DNA adenine methylase n=1 Tax=Klebsiella pneumoniae TaxID=573 RepID=UPI0025579DA6
VSELLFYIRKKNIETKKTINGKMEKKGCSIWKTSKKEYIKSPLNYIGGKYRILNQIMPLFPKDIKTFVDLFSGGGNVGINVKAEK